MKRIHCHISGEVQGVFFRVTTQNEAIKIGVTGWVQNLSDGRVEAVVEGDDEQVDEMLEYLHRGPSGASVDNVECIDEEYVGEFSDFGIIR